MHWRKIRRCPLRHLAEDTKYLQNIWNKYFPNIYNKYFQNIYNKYFQWQHWRQIKRCPFRHLAAEGPTPDLYSCRYSYIYTSFHPYILHLLYFWNLYTYVYTFIMYQIYYLHISVSKALLYFLYTGIHKVAFRNLLCRPYHISIDPYKFLSIDVCDLYIFIFINRIYKDIWIWRYIYIYWQLGTIRASIIAYKFIVMVLYNHQNVHIRFIKVCHRLIIIGFHTDKKDHHHHHRGHHHHHHHHMLMIVMILNIGDRLSRWEWSRDLLHWISPRPNLPSLHFHTFDNIDMHIDIFGYWMIFCNNHIQP